MKIMDFMSFCDEALGAIDSGGFINLRETSIKDSFLSQLYSKVSSATNISERSDVFVYFCAEDGFYTAKTKGKFETMKFRSLVKKAWKDISSKLPQNTMEMKLSPQSAEVALERVFGTGLVERSPWPGYVLDRKMESMEVGQCSFSETYHRMMKRRSDIIRPEGL